MQIKIPGHIVVKDIWQAQNAQKAFMSKLLGGRVIHDLRHFLPERDCMELATHIKEHRARLGMSQEETVMLAWVVMSCLMDLSLPAIVIPAVVLFVPVAISAGMAEKIKHDKQLFTYRAYDAFIQGEDPDVLNEKNQRAGKYWWGKLVAKTLIAAAIGACCGWGAFSILGRLIG